MFYALIVTVVLLSGAGLLYFLLVGSPQHPATQGGTETDIPKVSEQKPTDATSNSVKNNPTPQENQSSTPSPSSVNIGITSVNTMSDKVTIRTLIEKITSEGSCNLTMKNTSSGVVYEETVGVQALPSSSTCKGFTVPFSKLSSGTWSITIDYTVNGSVKGSAKGEVTVNA